MDNNNFNDAENTVEETEIEETEVVEDEEATEIFESENESSVAEYDEDDEDDEDDESDGKANEAIPAPVKKSNNGKILAAVIVLILVAAIAIAATILLTPQNDENEKKSDDTEETADSTDEYSDFDYSEGLDENGRWIGIDAAEYVALCDYNPIAIPYETATITDEDVQEQIDSLLSSYMETNEIKDRAVADGDTVNIDYVGTIDNVEFEGGNTNGTGRDVTIGVTTYIDDFLEQLIGHMPGETFDVNVTFPDDYEEVEEGETSLLNGKDAVFSVTINYISEEVLPEFTDDFVGTNLKDQYGWETVEEARQGIYDNLKENAYYNYINDYLLENCIVSDYPEAMYNYQKSAMLAYYSQYAASYSYTLTDMLSAMGYESIDAFVEANDDTLKSNVKRDLIAQAIADEINLTIDNDYIAQFFKDEYQIDDYTQYEEMYGHNYIVYATLGETVYKKLIENAVVDESTKTADTTEDTTADTSVDTAEVTE